MMGIAEFLKNEEIDCFIQYGDDRDVNIFYGTGFRAPDPVIHIITEEWDALIVSQMELNRALEESKVREVYSFEDLGWREFIEETGSPEKSISRMLIHFMKESKIRVAGIPPRFPSFITLEMMKELEVKVTPNPFSKMRSVKSSKEIEEIRKTAFAGIEAIKYARRILSSEEGRMKKEGIEVDSLRTKLEGWLFRRGYLALDTIIASGKESSNPHWKGEGLLRWDSSTILDVFPKNMKTGYYGDITRTIFTGNPEPDLVDMFHAVREAHDLAVKMLKEGITGDEIHNAVCDYFEESGYSTGRQGSKKGFIHSTGHGVGLEIHEKPVLSIKGEELKRGNIVTVEPGLYYPGIGGVRLENMYLVREKDSENLTPYRNEVWIK